MIGVRLMGGIGNQLFQYAFYRHIEELGFRDVLLDTNFFVMTDEELGQQTTRREFVLDQYQTVYRSFDSKGYAPCSRILYEDEQYSDLQLVSNDIYLVGYWQDLKHYHYVLQDIKKECRLKPEFIGEDALQIESEMDACNSVSLHVRRTDYLNIYNENLFAQCSLRYYQNAVERIRTETETDPVLYVFSDDMDWVRENMQGFSGCQTHFIDTGSANVDMHLMGKTHHNIIANSTFSWWAAFLNEREDHITIAPAVWRKDRPNPNLYLPEWIVMDNT